MIRVFDDVVVDAASVVAADAVVEAVEGGGTDVVAEVEADGPLDDCSAAAAAASDVSIVSKL